MTVVTVCDSVCDSAREVCPFFPGEIEMHKNFPDPAAFKDADEEVLPKVRVVRDKIKEWVEFTFCRGNLPKGDLSELYRE